MNCGAGLTVLSIWADLEKYRWPPRRARAQTAPGRKLTVIMKDEYEDDYDDDDDETD